MKPEPTHHHPVPAGNLVSPGKPPAQRADDRCPVRVVLDQLSDRWATLLLLQVEEAPVRFGALRRRLPGITPKVLGETLGRLESNGLVRREVICTRPIAVEYGLTDLGVSFMPVIHNMRHWALEHQALLTADRGGTMLPKHSRVQELRSDPTS